MNTNTKHSDAKPCENTSTDVPFKDNIQLVSNLQYLDKEEDSLDYEDGIEDENLIKQHRVNYYQIHIVNEVSPIHLDLSNINVNDEDDDKQPNKQISIQTSSMELTADHFQKEVQTLDKSEICSLRILNPESLDSSFLKTDGKEQESPSNTADQTALDLPLILQSQVQSNSKEHLKRESFHKYSYPTTQNLKCTSYFYTTGKRKKDTYIEPQKRTRSNNHDQRSYDIPTSSSSASTLATKSNQGKTYSHHQKSKSKDQSEFEYNNSHDSSTNRDKVYHITTTTATSKSALSIQQYCTFWNLDKIVNISFKFQNFTNSLSTTPFLLSLVHYPLSTTHYPLLTPKTIPCLLQV